jgi:predicted NBD/HSP70 family sugar kinase
LTPGARTTGEGRGPRRRSRPAASAPLRHGHIRLANTWSALQAVRGGGVVSRAEIGERTGLTAMSVHRIVAELRRLRLLVPAGVSPAGSVGRPSSLFRFNASIGHVIGIDVGNETTRAALTDLDGNRLAALELATSEIKRDLPGHLGAAIGVLQADAHLEPHGLMGLAVGVAGVTREDGTIIRASQHRLWDGLALGIHLTEAHGARVVVRQDDHLAALAELHRGACVDVRTAVLLNVGKGIGLGVITDGAVHAGAHGAAGRATWIPVGPDGLDGVAPALVGDVLTADGVIADYMRLGGATRTDGARGVFAADAAGDPAARAAVDLFVSRLAWLITAVVTILDPQVVVLGGGISRSFERLHEPLARRVAETIATPPPIVASTLGAEAVVSGAIDAAMDLADLCLKERIGD